jgi:uncharacterized Ntn-hydrolase superfamily protein
MECGTFAIVGRGSDGRRLGVAVAAALPAVGAFCPAVRAGVGAVSVQGQVHPLLRERVLDLLAEGVAADEALSRVLQGDGGREARQIVALGRLGPAAAQSGEGVAGFAGHRQGTEWAVAGSHLGRLDVLDAMAAAFADAPSHDLPERLMRALEAGQREGGDARGERSAAIVVADREGYPYLDLRVDDHPAPVDELRRLVNLQVERFLPGYEAWRSALSGEGGSR